MTMRVGGAGWQRRNTRELLITGHRKAIEKGKGDGSVLSIWGYSNGRSFIALRIRWCLRTMHTQAAVRKRLCLSLSWTKMARSGKGRRSRRRNSKALIKRKRAEIAAALTILSSKMIQIPTRMECLITSPAEKAKQLLLNQQEEAEEGPKRIPKVCRRNQLELCCNERKRMHNSKRQACKKVNITNRVPQVSSTLRTSSKTSN